MDVTDCRKYLQAHSMPCSYSDFRITVDSKLKFHQYIHTSVTRAGALANNLMKATLCRSSSFMITLYKTHISLILKFLHVYSSLAIQLILDVRVSTKEMVKIH